MSNQRSVSTILAANNKPNLRRLMQHSRHLKTLNKRITGLLPMPLSAHCKVLNQNGAILILLADSSAWATKLRLMTPKLIRALSNAGIHHIEIKITPEAKPHTPHERHASMSHSTGNLLNEFANSVTDAKLKASLKRLARHGTDTQ